MICISNRVGFFVFKIITIFLVVFILSFNITNVYAQILSPEERVRLEAELRQVEAEEALAQKQLDQAQSQSSSLTRDIDVLTARIKKAQLDIRAQNLKIQTLGNDIVSKEKHIAGLEEGINKGKVSIAQILRKTQELDSYGLPHILLSQSTLTGFFKDIDTFESIQSSMQELFDQLRADERETASEKEALEKRRNAEVDARYAIQQQEAEIKAAEAEKKKLLSISKGNEKSYKDLLAQKRARAIQIKSALFPLRDSEPIAFELALKYANDAATKTGVRAAYILAIAKQESEFGANVGKCNRLNDGPEKHWTKIMPGPNDKATGRSRRDDQTIFKGIMSNLGRSTEGVPLSCPFGNGWGGAMGPLQFIPTTWSLYEKRIANLTNTDKVDPWNAIHAFMAAGLLLYDNGAGPGTYTAEWNAACKYYSGNTCPTGKTYYTQKEIEIRSYGNGVIKKIEAILADINDLRGF